MQARAAFEVEIVQEIKDEVAGGGDEVIVPGHAVGIDRRSAPAIGKERRSEADVFHGFEGRFGNIATCSHIALRLFGTVIQHRNAITDELDMRQLFGGNRRDEAVKRTKLVLAAEIEALEHIIAECGHFSIFATQ